MTDFLKDSEAEPNMKTSLTRSEQHRNDLYDTIVRLRTELAAEKHHHATALTSLRQEIAAKDAEIADAMRQRNMTLDDVSRLERQLAAKDAELAATKATLDVMTDALGQAQQRAERAGAQLNVYRHAALRE